MPVARKEFRYRVRLAGEWLPVANLKAESQKDAQATLIRLYRGRITVKDIQWIEIPFVPAKQRSAA